jgi:hypothetical protein
MDNTVGCDSHHVMLKKILDLRTITSMLEVLQDPSLHTEVSERSQSNLWLQMLMQEFDSESDPRKEYRRILDALATLLAMDNEIVAATTKAATLLDSLTMEIVACSHVRHRSNSMSPADTAPSTLRDALEGMFLTIVVEMRL